MLLATPKVEKILSKLDLGSMWQWILSFALVTFDLELGHDIEASFPPIPFSDSEKRTLAFPDSNSMDNSGDTVFSFRMKNGEFVEKLYLKPSTQNDDSVKEGLPIDSDGFTYGFVFFRQQKDCNIKRGFFQKSLVLLSPHPWHGFFIHIISILGKRIMDSIGGSDDMIENLLEAACFEIARWPSPPSCWSSDITFDSIKIPIQFFGVTFVISFPPHRNYPQLHELRPAKNETIILCNPASFYELYSKSLDLLWSVWEIMILGEPICVLSETPSACSHVVNSFIEIIKPIPYGGDFRPYFTIQDPDFLTFTSKRASPQKSVILGTTNRIFIQILQSWPNIIQTGKPKIQPKQNGIPGLDFLSMNANNHDHATIETCTLNHKPFFIKDKKLLKTLLETGPNVIGIKGINNMLRKHFIEITQRFIQPIKKYFDSLVIGEIKMTLDTLIQQPVVMPFKSSVFLKEIINNEPNLGLIAKQSYSIVEFYQCFLRSVNFSAWLQMKTNDVYKYFRTEYLNTLCKTDLGRWYNKIPIKEKKIKGGDVLRRMRMEIERYSGFFIVEGNEVRLGYISNQPKTPSPYRTNIDDIFLEGVDLGSIDTSTLSRNTKKHSRAFTSPSTKCFSFDANIEVEENFKILEELKIEKNLRCLRSLGEFIPSLEQYSLLLEQFKVLRTLLNRGVE